MFFMPCAQHILRSFNPCEYFDQTGSSALVAVSISLLASSSRSILSLAIRMPGIGGMQLPGKFHRRFWIGRLPQYCASKDAADVYIRFHVARRAFDLATIPQCPDNHPRYLVTCVQVPERFKDRRGILALCRS
jgi:hypothetical protein